MLNFGHTLRIIPISNFHCKQLVGINGYICTHMHIFGRSILTYNGKDHHHKIKDIPAYREVVVSQGDELQYKFPSEQNNEDKVDPGQNQSHVFALVVRFHHHGDHVEANEDHDADVKDLSCDKIKDHPLKFILEMERKEVFMMSYNGSDPEHCSILLYENTALEYSR